jgi:hypothetical protein
VSHLGPVDLVILETGSELLILSGIDFFEESRQIVFQNVPTFGFATFFESEFHYASSLA